MLPAGTGGAPVAEGSPPGPPGEQLLVAQVGPVAVTEVVDQAQVLNLQSLHRTHSTTHQVVTELPQAQHRHSLGLSG